ncbi:MAG: DUF6624 domain-containing protein [Ferruginibacter sp.]
MKLSIFLFGFIIYINSLYAQDSIYNSVTQQLLKIDELDQRYRNQIEYIETKYGRNSNELKYLLKEMDLADSMNLIQVESILNKYGWLGNDKIGSQANTTLFLVIQHSDLSIQEKYLPLMKEAVKKGNAKARDFALLEDRVAVFQGKMQNYGSQLFWSRVTNAYFILPLADPDNVDKRRAEVGLQPLSDYVNKWNVKWNVEEYKKNLPAISAEWKSILQQIKLK